MPIENISRREPFGHPAVAKVPLLLVVLFYVCERQDENVNIMVRVLCGVSSLEIIAYFIQFWGNSEALQVQTKALTRSSQFVCTGGTTTLNQVVYSGQGRGVHDRPTTGGRACFRTFSWGVVYMANSEHLVSRVEVHLDNK